VGEEDQDDGPVLMLLLKELDSDVVAVDGDEYRAR